MPQGDGLKIQEKHQEKWTGSVQKSNSSCKLQYLGPRARQMKETLTSMQHVNFRDPDSNTLCFNHGVDQVQTVHPFVSKWSRGSKIKSNIGCLKCTGPLHTLHSSLNKSLTMMLVLPWHRLAKLQSYLRLSLENTCHDDK